MEFLTLDALCQLILAVGVIAGAGYMLGYQDGKHTKK